MANKKKEVAPVAKINDTDLKGKFIIRKLLIDNPLLTVKCRITKSFCHKKLLEGVLAFLSRT